MNIRPRRSLLFMPASNARAIEKARTLPADGIVLDLEDAVAPEAKADAREQAFAAVAAGGFGPREVFVRLNGIDTPWFADELEAAALHAPDAIIVPKIAHPDQFELIGERLLSLKADVKTRVWAMIETPAAIFNLPALAAMARDSETRLAGFILGTNDLAKDTHARLVPGRAPMLNWLSQAVLAARAYGIAVIDGVYNDIADGEGFMRECEQGRDFGFDGKALIHPGQIGPCNAVFSPTEAEIEAAQRVLAAFERPENHDKGVVQVEGRMVERLHADMAARTIAIADAIAARDRA